MKVWITRDDDGICLWEDRANPSKEGDLQFYGSVSPYAYLSSKTFKERYGFTPRKGSCKQYELTLKEIK